MIGYPVFMKTKTKKLHLSIRPQRQPAKGLRVFLYKQHASIKLRTLGLSKRDIYDHKEKDLVEIVTEGDMKDLWKVINWSRKGFTFFSIREVIFQFTDV
jgi:hypothetical protein